MLGMIFLVLVVIASIGGIGYQLFTRYQQHGIMAVIPVAAGTVPFMLCHLIWGRGILNSVYRSVYPYIYSGRSNGFFHLLWCHAVNIGNTVVTGLHPLLLAMIMLWLSFGLGCVIMSVFERDKESELLCIVTSAVISIPMGLISSMALMVISGIALLALGAYIAFAILGATPDPCCRNCKYYNCHCCQLDWSFVDDPDHTKCNCYV